MIDPISFEPQLDKYYSIGKDTSKIKTQARWHYWRSLFKYTQRKDQEDLLRRYLDAHNISVLDISILQNGKLVLPVLDLTKDLLLCDLLFEKKSKGHILIIGFWDKKLMFNLGLNYDFKVDGLDLHQPVIDIANKRLSELSEEDRSRFKIHKRFGDDLDHLPMYDVIINIIPEHLQDPRYATIEHLRHLKPDGIYYLTTPWKYGCSSPGHIHQFLCPEDIKDLFPEGYSITFHKTKYQESDPYENYLVVEIEKDVL